ncbi:MAG: hypothetical protein KC635_24820, partial [Myxococcales bacterium]|nr:hypothetical protein [Myxococcales bacterium]
DGDACTTDDACDAAGACAGVPRICDDGDVCTRDACDPELGCVAPPDPARPPCDDGDVCTDGDRCGEDGRCHGGNAPCDDGDPCTYDLCSPGVGCNHYLSALPCDDLDPCTSGDVCRGGVCSGTPIRCDDGDPCTRDGCDAALGRCTSVPAPEGAPCDDRDACTLADRCHDGDCAGLPVACDDGLACTFDACEPGGACSHLPAPGFCVSASGACVAVGARPLDAPCEVCAATGVLVADPAREGTPCDDDGVACTYDRCEGGACVHPPVSGTCHDGDGVCYGAGELMTGCLRCVGSGVATPLAEGSACDDDGGGACAVGSCDALGTCVATPLPCCPLGELACGEAVDVAASELSPGSVTIWPCAGEQTPGPERSFRVAPGCAGELRLTLTGDPSLRLAVTRGANCTGGACVVVRPSPAAVPVQASDVFTVTVDGTTTAAQGFRLEAACTCTPPRP